MQLEDLIPIYSEAKYLINKATDVRLVPPFGDLPNQLRWLADRLEEFQTKFNNNTK